MHYRVLSALLRGAFRDVQAARAARRDAGAHEALPAGPRGALLSALPPRAPAALHWADCCARHWPRVRRSAEPHTRPGDDRGVLVPSDGARAPPSLPPARRGRRLEDARARLQAAARAIADGVNALHVRLLGCTRVQPVHSRVLNWKRGL